MNETLKNVLIHAQIDANNQFSGTIKYKMGEIPKECMNGEWIETTADANDADATGDDTTAAAKGAPPAAEMNSQDADKAELFKFLTDSNNYENPPPTESFTQKFGIEEAKYVSKLEKKDLEKIRTILKKEKKFKYNDLISVVEFEDEKTNINLETIKQSRWGRFFTFGRKQKHAKLIPPESSGQNQNQTPKDIEITIFKEKGNLNFDGSKYMMKIKLTPSDTDRNPAVYLDEKFKILGFTKLDGTVLTDKKKNETYQKYVGWRLEEVKEEVKKGGNPKAKITRKKASYHKKAPRRTRRNHK
jgi:hypothetical protein